MSGTWSLATLNTTAIRPIIKLFVVAARQIWNRHSGPLQSNAMSARVDNRSSFGRVDCDEIRRRGSKVSLCCKGRSSTLDRAELGLAISLARILRSIEKVKCSAYLLELMLDLLTLLDVYGRSKLLEELLLSVEKISYDRRHLTSVTDATHA